MLWESSHSRGVREKGSTVFIKQACAVFRQEAFVKSCCFALPSALAAFVIEALEHELPTSVITSFPDDVYKGFTATLSMLLVFRSIQALNQYREGATCIYHMVGSWYDAASTLIAFTRCSTASKSATANFQHTLIRLFSLMNMFCLAELEDKGEGVKKQSFGFTVLDAESLDPYTLAGIRDSSFKSEVVCQHIQCLVVDTMNSGVLNVPPPIMTRSFQDLSNGILKFHEALKLAQVPVPLPLKVATNCLLLVNACGTPFVLSRWTEGEFEASFYTFLQVMILFLLNFLAGELDNPFSGDMNDIDTKRLHDELNLRLLTLLEHGSDRPATTCRQSISIPIHKLRNMIKNPIAKTESEHSRETLGDVDVFLERIVRKSAFHAGIVGSESECGSTDELDVRLRKSYLEFQSFQTPQSARSNRSQLELQSHSETWNSQIGHSDNHRYTSVRSPQSEHGDDKKLFSSSLSSHKISQTLRTPREDVICMRTPPISTWSASHIMNDAQRFQ